MSRDTKTADTRKACARAADAVAWALGNPPAADCTTWEAHLRVCPACQTEVAQARAWVARLRALPKAEPAPDLADRIVAALPPRRTTRWRLFVRPLAAAAAALLVAGVWLATGHSRRAPQLALVEGAEWLVRCQATDGSWDPARAGGDPAYRPALTALAALALVEAHAPQQTAVDRAIRALLSTQEADGAFGPPSTTQPYNHGIVTCALLTIEKRRAGAVPEPALRRAVAFVQNHQTVAGGWGYSPDAPANTAITVWQLEALARARDLGWGDPDGHLRRGLRWLRAQAGGDGHFAYPAAGVATQHSPTLDAMGAYALLTAGSPHPELLAAAGDTLRALQFWTVKPAGGADIYRDFFVARALDQGGCRQQAAGLRQRLAESRATHGSEKGSWRPDEAWGRVGGRVGATTLAMLALK
jgi:hypothetical protein